LTGERVELVSQRTETSTV